MRAVLSLIALLLLCACGGGAASASSEATQARAGASTAGAELTDWPEFGLDPQRSDASNRPTGITAANLNRLSAQRISLAGTADSSPIYLHGVSVAGASHDLVVVTTTYGRTIAIDANSGRVLWTFTPPGYGHWAGSAQITNASPIADPDRHFIYAASPNGLIHKLSLSSGHEDSAGAWPVSVTRDPTREKLGSALNIDGPDVIATTSGYIGDTPVYQGHVALISRASGRLRALFNTLCANRHRLIVPRSCPQSDSAILSRGGAVVEPGGRRLLIDTGNGNWNGRTDFGDSVLELAFPRLTLRQAFTPTDQEKLNTEDIDLGSSAPALLGHNRVLVAGKDGILRLLDLRRLDGRSPAARESLGGELQTLRTPGGGELFTAPAVWREGSHTTVFLADEDGTSAFRLRGGRLHPLWSNSTGGTSPILAGGLLYVYDSGAGGIEVYSPGSPRPIGKLAGSSGHWNSPIVVDGHVVEPEGDANEHELTGSLELFSLR
ncbi:MAG: PQQ-binding-like beta-propeller repeat protein [Solirubrobacterales bacterium]